MARAKSDPVATESFDDVYFRYRHAVRTCKECPAREKLSNSEVPSPCDAPMYEGQNVRALILTPKPDLYGTAKTKLEEWLATVGLTVGYDAVLSAAVRCPYPGDSRWSEKFAQACMRFLKAEIALFAPELLVTFGVMPARLLTGRSVHDYHGRVEPFGSGHIFCTFHPGQAGMSPKVSNALYADAEVLRRWLAE